MEKIIRYTDETKDIIDSALEIFYCISEMKLKIKVYDLGGNPIDDAMLTIMDKKLLSLLFGFLMTDGIVCEELNKKGITKEGLFNLFQIPEEEIKFIPASIRENILKVHFKDTIDYLLKTDVNTRGFDLKRQMEMQNIKNQSMLLYYNLNNLKEANVLFSAISLELTQDDLVTVLTRIAKKSINS